MAPQRLQLTWYNKDKALIPTERGKYGYTWVDPSDPRYCETHRLVFDEYVRGAQSPKTDDFQYSERADLEPQEDNLLIHGESGDVLEALTRVPELADKYLGKVKLIYIDPPFNTAQTFSNYEDNLEHSVWLTMMRDRLLHMKKLLSDDGSIWVHLDYSENHRMRLLLDEVFGAASFTAEVVWEKHNSRENRAAMSQSTDVVLLYTKQGPRAWKDSRNLLDHQDKGSNPDRDPRGPWTAAPITAQGTRPNQMYEIVTPAGTIQLPPPGRCWSMVEENMEKLRKDKRLYFGASGANQPVKKNFVSEKSGLVPHTLWRNQEVGANSTGKDELTKLFENKVPFSTPKPERLIERVIHIGTNPGDIVMDVFGGSGTTAAVAQKMGRRWVTCELVQDTFERFTKPRLTKVVNDEDPGGITSTKGERVPADGVTLPEGVSPDDAAKFTSVLNKLIADDPGAKKDPRVKALKAASKTKRTKTVINWRGGGGFQVAHLSPSCFDYDAELDRVTLTEAATGRTLVESVAANLGFALLHAEDDYIFDAKRGNALLKVVEGTATVEVVDWLVASVQPGETIVLAATSVMDGVREHLRRAVKGSRVVSIPDDIFQYSKEGEH